MQNFAPMQVFCVRGEPLMIWGAAGREFAMSSFFLANWLMSFFLAGGAVNFFSLDCARARLVDECIVRYRTCIMQSNGDFQVGVSIVSPLAHVSTYLCVIRCDFNFVFSFVLFSDGTFCFRKKWLN